MYKYPVRYVPNPQRPVDYSTEYVVLLGNKYLCKLPPVYGQFRSEKDSWTEGELCNAWYTNDICTANLVAREHKGKVVKL